MLAFNVLISLPFSTCTLHKSRPAVWHKDGSAEISHPTDESGRSLENLVAFVPSDHCVNMPRASAIAAGLVPHRAQDLSDDDDLLSWILVDQLGALPGTKLGVFPQNFDFSGPQHDSEEVLGILQEVSWDALTENLAR